MRRHFTACVHHCGIDKETILHTFKQRIPKGWLAVLAAEGAVCIQHQAPLGLPRVVGCRTRLPASAQIVAWRCGKAQFVTNKIVKYCARVSRNRAMCFIRDYKIKVRRRKQPLKFIVKQQRLHCGHHNFCALPFIALFFINHRAEIRSQQCGKRLRRLHL